MAGLTVDQLQVLITADIAGLKKGISDTKSQISSLEGSTSQFSAKSAAAFAAVTSVITVGLNKAISMVTSTISGAISRVDTLNNSARTFNNMGFKTEDSQKALAALSKSIMGLPTSLDAGVRGMTSLAATYGDVDKGQKVFSALNNAILGFGGTADSVNNAILQLSQVPMDGPLDAQTWNSLRNSGLTPVLVAMSKDMGISISEMKDKFGEGELKVKDFTDMLLKMDKDGGGGMKSLAQIAQDSTKGIGTGFTNAQTAVTRGIANIISSIGSDKISKTIADFGKGFETVLTSVSKSIPSVLKELQPLLSGIQDFAGKALDVATKVGQYLMPAISGLYGIIKDSFIPAISNAIVKLQPFAESVGIAAVFAINLLIQAITVAVGFVSSFIDMIANNTVAFSILTVGVMAVIASFAIYKATVVVITAMTAVYTAVSVTLSAILAIQAQGVSFLRAAWILLNLSMAANPIGLVIAACAGLVAVLALLTYATNDSKTEEQRLNNERLKSIDIANRIKDGENALKDARYAQEGAALAVESAQKRLNDMTAQYGPKSLEARQAAHDLEGAQGRLKESSDKVTSSIDKITAAQQANIDKTNAVIASLDKLNGKSVTYYINGQEMVAQKMSNGQTITTAKFADGGFTGRGGKNEPAGIVHKGEYVLPQKYVDQTTGLPNLSAFANKGINMGTSRMVGATSSSLSSSSAKQMTSQDASQSMQTIIVKIGEDTLINKVVKGINNLSYMNNSTVLEV